MTTNDIDAIRNLADAATEGPWAIESYDVAYVEGYRVVDARVDYVAGNFDNEAGGVLRGEDAEFIAAARTLVPALCDEIEQLRAEREHMELHPTGTVEWLRNRVNELTAELAKVRTDRDEEAALAAQLRTALDDVARARTQETHQ